MRFEKEVNPNPHGGGVVHLTLFPMGAVVETGPNLSRLYMFFSPDPTPFSGSGELCSNYFYKTMTFVPMKTFCFFFNPFQVSDPEYHRLNLE